MTINQRRATGTLPERPAPVGIDEEGNPTIGALPRRLLRSIDRCRGELPLRKKTRGVGSRFTPTPQERGGRRNSEQSSGALNSFTESESRDLQPASSPRYATRQQKRASDRRILKDVSRRKVKVVDQAA